MWNEYFAITFVALGIFIAVLVFIGVVGAISHFAFTWIAFILESKLPTVWSYILSIVVGLVMLYLLIMVFVLPMYLLYMYGPH